MNLIIRFKIIRSWWSMRFKESAYTKWSRSVDERIGKERTGIGQIRLIRKGGDGDE